MSARGCVVVDCERPHNSHGYCGMHGKRLERQGTTDHSGNPRNFPILDRLMYYVEKTDTCWHWVGMTCSRGYGRIAYHGGLKQAHRISYELHVGPIPDGLEIDHLCRVRHCVNPEHLEPVTHKANVMRAPLSLPNVASNLTKCIEGHTEDERAWTANSNFDKFCRSCTYAKALAAWTPMMAIA